MMIAGPRGGNQEMSPPHQKTYGLRKSRWGGGGDGKRIKG